MNWPQPKFVSGVKVILVPHVCFALQPESQLFAVVSLPLQVGVMPCVPTIMWPDMLFVSSYILAASCLCVVPRRHASVPRGPQSFLLKKVKSENRKLVCGVYAECAQAGCVTGNMVANPQ